LLQRANAGVDPASWTDIDRFRVVNVTLGSETDVLGGIHMILASSVRFEAAYEISVKVLLSGQPGANPR
jgi:hypothetical protein